MKKLLIILLILSSFALIAKEQNTNLTDLDNIKILKDSIREISSEINILRYEFDVIKRDKINYEIEKNILKESFNENMQTLNIILTGLLLFFTIIGGLVGYFGFKNLKDLKVKFEDDLTKLRSLTSTYEKRFNGLINREKIFKEKMEKIEETNLIQTKRIRILEIKNNVDEAIKRKNYNYALDLIKIGLDDDPDDYSLHAYRAQCFSDLRNIQGALDENLVTLELAKKSNSHLILNNIYNVLECMLLLNKSDDYERYKLQYESYLKYKTINTYFEGLKLFNQKDLTGLKGLLTDYFLTTEKDVVFPGWRFDDVLWYINKNSSNPCYDLINDYFNVILKKINKDTFLEKYKQ